MSQGNFQLSISFTSLNELEAFIKSWKKGDAIEEEFVPVSVTKLSPSFTVDGLKNSGQRNRWTERENEFIRKNLLSLGLEATAKELGRTRESLSTQCSKMRVKDKSFPRIREEYSARSIKFKKGVKIHLASDGVHVD